MRNFWMKGIVAGLGLAMLTGVARAQRDDQPRAPQGNRNANNANSNANQVQPGDLPRVGDAQEIPGPIDSPKDVQDTLKMVFMAADTNKDGLISKKEATDAADLVVGGFFFRADANGDGTLTQDEARQVREDFLNRQPILRVLVQEVRNERGNQAGTNQQSPFRGVADLLDANNDKQIQAAEVRQAIQTGVEGVYAAADTDRDGQMSPGELNAAAIGLARAAGQAAFRAADTDNNGAISQAEFEKAIVEPARVVFKAVDANNDSQIDEQEARSAQQLLMSRMHVTIPDARGTQAPVPNLGNARAPQGRPGAAPSAPRETPRPR